MGSGSSEVTSSTLYSFEFIQDLPTAMMSLLKLAFVMPCLGSTSLPAPEGSSLDALQKRFPNSGSHGLKSAAKWLEDSYGAATAEDLNGVSNFAVDAMSFAAADEGLSADAKLVLRRLFLNEPDAKPQDQGDQKKTDEAILSISFINDYYNYYNNWPCNNYNDSHNDSHNDYNINLSHGDNQHHRCQRKYY